MEENAKVEVEMRGHVPKIQKKKREKTVPKPAPVLTPVSLAKDSVRVEWIESAVFSHIFPCDGTVSDPKVYARLVPEFPEDADQAVMIVLRHNGTLLGEVPIIKGAVGIGKLENVKEGDFVTLGIKCRKEGGSGLVHGLGVGFMFEVK